MQVQLESKVRQSQCYAAFFLQSAENFSFMKSNYDKLTCPHRYQDVHNQAYIMVMASARWLGMRLDCLASLLVGAVAVAAVLVSQDAGKLKILGNVFESFYLSRICIVIY